MREWHATFTPGEDALIQGINQGFPTAVTFAIDSVLGKMLRDGGAKPDMPMGANQPGTYVSGELWAEEQGCGAGGQFAVVPRWGSVTQAPPPSVLAARPLQEVTQPPPRTTKWLTEDQCMQRIRLTDIDWSAPLHPGKHACDREALEHDISAEEQAQAHYYRILLRELELEDNTKIAYDNGVRKWLVYLNRGYPLHQWSADHLRLALTGLFEPAVWKPSEIEAVLLDTVLHEAAVRGNAWSTVKTQMYGIRHLNVSQGLPDPLKNKLRYDQLMRALKKFRGPKEGKSPVTRAMLFALCKELDWETDPDDLVKYAAALVAFHFMLRSAEYCARLTGGRFDLDRIIRLMDVTFFLKGVEIFTHLECADEVEVTLGKQKCSTGGERRRHSASLSCPDLCVVRILAMLVTKKGRSARHLPLFTWVRGSTHPGDGVRYHDMRKLAQRAAELCGRCTKDYATHSWRRGGASAYILAGCSLQSIQLYGRWALLSSLKLYVEPVVGQMMKGAQERVLMGIEEVRIVNKPEPRPRAFNMHRAKTAVRKLTEESN